MSNKVSIRLKKFSPINNFVILVSIVAFLMILIDGDRPVYISGLILAWLILYVIFYVVAFTNNKANFVVFNEYDILYRSAIRCKWSSITKDSEICRNRVWGFTVTLSDRSSSEIVIPFLNQIENKEEVVRFIEDNNLTDHVIYDWMKKKTKFWELLIPGK